MAHSIVAMHAGKRAKRLKLTDFLLTWGRGKRQTPEEQLNIFRALAARQEGMARGDDR